MSVCQRVTVVCPCASRPWPGVVLKATTRLPPSVGFGCVHSHGRCRRDAPREGGARPERLAVPTQLFPSVVVVRGGTTAGTPRGTTECSAGQGNSQLNARRGAF